MVEAVDGGSVDLVPLISNIPAMFAFISYFLYCRSLPDNDGVRVLEGEARRRPRRLRPLLPQEPLPRRVHHLRGTLGVPQVPRELPILGQR